MPAFATFGECRLALARRNRRAVPVAGQAQGVKHRLKLQGLLGLLPPLGLSGQHRDREAGRRLSRPPRVPALGGPAFWGLCMTGDGIFLVQDAASLRLKLSAKARCCKDDAAKICSSVSSFRGSLRCRFRRPRLGSSAQRFRSGTGHTQRPWLSAICPSRCSWTA